LEVVNLIAVPGLKGFPMCDYSLHSIRTRPAKVGDKLTTRLFETGTRGFCAPEDADVAVCVLPGTELSFAKNVRRERFWFWHNKTIQHRTAIFRQINKDSPFSHHDALEFPDGHAVLLTFLEEGQQATVLQLPVTHEGVKVPEQEPINVD
jgi:hypothetical protein